MPQTELSPEERSEIIEGLVQRVISRRLETAAILFLEMHKPLAFLGGQAMLVAAPIAGTLFGYENMQRLALFFQNAENVELLIQRIEAVSRERDQGERDRRPADGACPHAHAEGSQ